MKDRFSKRNKHAYRTIKILMLLEAAFICSLTPVFATELSLQQKLQAIPGISDVQPLENDIYSEKYVFKIEQMLDPHDSTVGTFQQRVIVGHVGYDRPTVIVTEGYHANYAMRPGYQEELSKLFQANVVVVEYRYFDQSMPDPCLWEYLTVEASMYDLHHVTTMLKTIYPNKWMSTGISKGGETCMCYRAFFPEDVAVSVPYVAPLSRALEDGRHEPFIAKKVSTPQNRQRVKDFQLEVLKRKSQLLPMFEQYCAEKSYTFRVPVEDIFDYDVLEYAFSFWQFGTPIEDIPELTAEDSVLFAHLIKVCEPDYFSQQTSYHSFNVQATKELGYYGYDIRPFKKYMSIKSSKNYMYRVMLPEEFGYLKFDDTLYKKVVKFLKQNDLPMIYLYGGDDPWTASGVTWLKEKENIRIYVLPGGNHRTRIASFDTDTQEEIKAQIKVWLNE